MIKVVKRKELQKCSTCHNGVMHTGLPIFWIIEVQRFGVDPGAVQRRHGLELMLNSPVLADVMGPDEALAKPITPGEPTRLFICEMCISDKFIPLVAAYSEQQSKDEARMAK